ncbi:hypothetical protein C4544_05730 [candidate division WS5 bacterium]|uniref:G5 domain-containing protein n=1 Tax=candidate division WS5 bacterium TaxID=2093353 RepID=A0A419DAX6_9BACT|nr:MAG: hypothetical protein C4544_05730 [candidate division WS5 bacterium]
MAKKRCPKCAEKNDIDDKQCFYCDEKLKPSKKKTGKTKKGKKLGFIKNRKFYIPALIILGVVIIAVLPLPHTSTETFSVPYETQYVQSSDIELGENQINQQGTNGQGLTKTELVSPIFAYIIRKSGDIKYSIQKQTETTQAPVSKIVANGTKRYQYMWCSNGAYRYYTNDQFKNAFTGFTHKSPDTCAQNNQGHMTQLSDVAPQAPTTVYQTAPSRLPTPTTTRCYDDILTGGITCSTSPY